jgi:hypothetical protein
VKLGVRANPRVTIIIQKATEDKSLVPVGSWAQQEDGNWISEEWGGATKAEMVDKVETLCRNLLLV